MEALRIQKVVLRGSGKQKKESTWLSILTLGFLGSESDTPPTITSNSAIVESSKTGVQTTISTEDSSDNVNVNFHRSAMLHLISVTFDRSV